MRFFGPQPHVRSALNDLAKKFVECWNAGMNDFMISGMLDRRNAADIEILSF